MFLSCYFIMNVNKIRCARVCKSVLLSHKEEKTATATRSYTSSKCRRNNGIFQSYFTLAFYIGYTFATAQYYSNQIFEFLRSEQRSIIRSFSLSLFGSRSLAVYQSANKCENSFLRHCTHTYTNHHNEHGSSALSIKSLDISLMLRLNPLKRRKRANSEWIYFIYLKLVRCTMARISVN